MRRPFVTWNSAASQIRGLTGRVPNLLHVLRVAKTSRFKGRATFTALGTPGSGS